MQVQEYANDNTLWIEITGQKGFLMFGDLSREIAKQRNSIITGSSSKVDIICSNCRHKLPFEVVKENGEKVWNWKHWRVFLKGNQVSMDRSGYCAKLEVRFYCAHCQGWLKKKND